MRFEGPRWGPLNPTHAAMRLHGWGTRPPAKEQSAMFVDLAWTAKG
jgi:hypothetical protein